MRFVAALLAGLLFLQGLAVPRSAEATDPTGAVTSAGGRSKASPSEVSAPKSGRRWWPWVVAAGAVAAAVFVGLVIYSANHFEPGSAYDGNYDVGGNLPVLGGSSSGGG